MANLYIAAFMDEAPLNRIGLRTEALSFGGAEIRALMCSEVDYPAPGLVRLQTYLTEREVVAYTLPLHWIHSIAELATAKLPVGFGVANPASAQAAQLDPPRT